MLEKIAVLVMGAKTAESLITEIKGRIQAAMADAKIEVRDSTGGGDHFEIDVKSKSFLGLPLIQQHRLVYQALGDLFQGPLHAAKIKTSAETGE